MVIWTDRTMKQFIFIFTILTAMGTVACSGSEESKPDATSLRAYGVQCGADEECESNLCVKYELKGAEQGVCSKACKRQTDCGSHLGQPFDCGEVAEKTVACYPRTYKTGDYVIGHDCSLDGKCAVGYICTGQPGDADRYCAATCKNDMNCPPKYRCASMRVGKGKTEQRCLLRKFCHPCVVDDQCGGEEDLCIKDKNGNGYCSKACSKTAAGTCPDYAKCEDAGNSKLQCRHKKGICFKSFDKDGDLCDPCFAHGWKSDNLDMLTIAEDGICKTEGFCFLLDPKTGEAACIMPCGSGETCPDSTYACGTFDSLGGKFCIPIKVIQGGYKTIGSCAE